MPFVRSVETATSGGSTETTSPALESPCKKCSRLSSQYLRLNIRTISAGNASTGIPLLTPIVILSSHEDDDRSDSENTFSEIEAESSSRDASTSVRPSAMSRSSWWLHSRSRGRQNSDASSRTSIKDIINPHGESHEERQSDLKRAMTLSDISSVANSAATRSSAQSTLLRDESNRQQEQVILFRLKKSSLLALILVCAIELSSMAVERSMKQNHSLVMDRVIKSGSRGM